MVDPLSAAVTPLIEWYQSGHAEYPWRQSPTPYHVWISEIMLQQTRIEAVLPYYARFLSALPDVASLAAVEADVLMKLWQGLGYYSRARNLQKAAQILCRDYGGRLPETAEELQKLPGIGAYTAGAISSIAYGHGEPAVDGNVLRVGMRLLASRDDITLPATKAGLTKQLRDVYPAGKDAGLLTQAWMELGERICIPNGTPDCLHCPLSEVCRGCALGIADELPVRSGKKPRRMEERTVFLLICNGKYAIRKRPSNGLLANLWELPNCEGCLTVEETVSRFPAASDCNPLGSAKHIFTHVEWHMTGYLLHLSEELPEYRWAAAEEITEKYAIPTAFRFYAGQII